MSRKRGCTIAMNFVQLRTTKLTDRIELNYSDFEGLVKWIDFAFYVPDSWVPVLIEFRQNNVAEVPSPVSGPKAPEAIPFIKKPA